MSIKKETFARFFRRVFWDGGSAFDGWLNMAATKTSQTLLSFPYAVAQMGLPSAIAMLIAQPIIGCWSSWMMNILYLEYRQEQEKRDPEVFEGHTIQMHEVLGGLLGRSWQRAALTFNFLIMFSFTAIEITASANFIYYLDNSLDRRTWTLIFGSCFALSVLVPSARNYRMCSFAGLVMITYVAMFMALSSFIHGKDAGVRHTGPKHFAGYFIGFSNIVIFGAHIIPVELMDAMWEPAKYKVTSMYADLYGLFLVMVSSTSVYWAFGDKVKYNAFSNLSRSKFRDTAVVLIILHQFFQFGILALPLYHIVEKFFKLHKSPNYWKRTLVRIPIFLASWFVAIMFPFFGVLNSVAGSIFMSWLYILPCAATMVRYRSRRSQMNAVEKPPLGMNWLCLHCINAGVILWMAIMAGGLGSWASIINLKNQEHEFGLFAKCYQCDRKN